MITPVHDNTNNDDPQVAAFDTEAMKLALQGVTLLAASGDSGVSGDDAIPACGYNPDFPASSPWVTSVGATQGPEWGWTETACSGINCGFTSGGGFSNMYRSPISQAADTVLGPSLPSSVRPLPRVFAPLLRYPTPAWQRPAVNGYFALLASNGRLPFTNASYASAPGNNDAYPYPTYNVAGRGYPDLALLGVRYLTAINASFFPLDGTSASAPVAAGMVALVNAARATRGLPSLGFLNPALYALADNPTARPSPAAPGAGAVGSRGRSPSFNRDVQTGNNHCGKGEPLLCCNHGFTAAPGWCVALLPNAFEGLSPRLLTTAPPLLHICVYAWQGPCHGARIHRLPALLRGIRGPASARLRGHRHHGGRGQHRCGPASGRGDRAGQQRRVGVGVGGGGWLGMRRRTRRGAGRQGEGRGRSQRRRRLRAPRRNRRRHILALRAHGAARW